MQRPTMALSHTERLSRDLMENCMVRLVQEVAIMVGQFFLSILALPLTQNSPTFRSRQVCRKETWCKLPTENCMRGHREVFITIQASFLLIPPARIWNGFIILIPVMTVMEV